MAICPQELEEWEEVDLAGLLHAVFLEEVEDEDEKKVAQNLGPFHKALVDRVEDEG